MSDHGTLPRIVAAAARALDRLEADVSTEESVLALFAELGFALPIAPPTVLDLSGDIGDVVTASEQLATAIDAYGEDSIDALAALAELSIALGITFGAVAKSWPEIEADLSAYPKVLARIDGEEIVGRLLEHVLLSALAAEVPVVYSALLLVGAIDETITAPADEDDDVVVQRVIRRLRPERFKKLTHDPEALLLELYGWGGDGFDHALLLTRAAYSLRAVGVAVDLVPAPSILGATPDTAGLEVVLLREVSSESLASVGLDLAPIGQAGDTPAPGLVAGLVASGSASTEITLREGLKLILEVALAEGAPLALELRPAVHPKLRLGGADVRADAELKWARADGTRQRLIAAGDWLLFDTGGIRALVGLQGATGAPLEPRVEVGIVDAAFRLGGGRGDGFIQKLLPADGITLPFGLDARWTPGGGVKLVGGPSTDTDFRVKVPLDISIGGVIDVHEVDIVAHAVKDHGFSVRVTADVGVKIGPITGVIEQIGLELKIDPDAASKNLGVVDLGLGFAFPKGLGASVKAGPVSGGGYLFFDPDEQRYAGALQLSIKVVNITAIGLLTTKMPDGSQGFSLLVIITAEFPPIQLGFGFSLNGVGGLVGINRTMRLDPLRDGVRNHSLDAILFPTDVVANAQRLVAAIGAIFPPAPGRFVFGPMVKLGWGPNALIDIEAALVLELPSPLRLAILGRIRIALPTKKEAVVDLRLDVVGILDFDRSEASIDASLVDSRIAIFTLTGDMAFRLGWGATKAFALSAGGFHPSFAPPPGFPTLRRLAIALGNSDNPRLRLETYLAITSNTVQFGAKLDLYVAYDTVLGRFSAAAYIGFDTLIQIDPFHLTASLGAGIDILRDGKPLLHAQLSATLDGPTPWHAVGFAEFECFGKHRIGFELTAGDGQTPPSTLVNVDDLLVAELARPEVWVTLPPGDGSATIATLRDATPGLGAVVHPLGGVGLHQRLVPFGKTISRFGAATVERGSVRYDLSTLWIGTAGGVPVSVLDEFAPAQFEALTDDQKLARPAFESMPAGGVAAPASLMVPTAAAGRVPGIVSEQMYRESVIDDQVTRSRRVRRTQRSAIRPLPDAMYAALQKRPTVGFPAPDGPRIGLSPERFVVAGGDTLMTMSEPGDGVSASQAADAARAIDPAGQTAVVVAAHEAS